MEISKIVRNDNGLIANVNYVLNEEGLIDWRKMVEPEFLVPNKRVFEKNDQAIPASIDGLEDSQLLILLGGIKKLAKLRGFSKVNFEMKVPNENYVAVVCSIDWLPNFETEGRSIVFSGIADAHPNNTDGFGRNFLAAIAENRAFVRCVRNFLGINIVGQDEVSSMAPNESAVPLPPTSAAALLENLMMDKNVSFETIKAKLVTELVDGASNFNSVSDIPKVKIFELIERLRKKKN